MKKFLWSTLTLLFWAGVWYACALLVNQPLLLPGPAETAKAWWQLAGTVNFWKSTGTTMLRVLIGHGAAVIVGSLLALLCAFFALPRRLFSPLRTVIRATPVTSFIILVLIWLQRGHVPVFISFLTVLPIMWTGVEEGLRGTDEQLLEMAAAYDFSHWKKLRYIYWPSVKPHFLTSWLNGLGFSWKSGVAAEVIALPAFSVGKNLNDAKVYLERENLFAWTITVIVLSMALEALLKRALKGRKKA